MSLVDPLRVYSKIIVQLLIGQERVTWRQSLLHNSLKVVRNLYHSAVMPKICKIVICHLPPRVSSPGLLVGAPQCRPLSHHSVVKTVLESNSVQHCCSGKFNSKWMYSYVICMNWIFYKSLISINKMWNSVRT